MDDIEFKPSTPLTIGVELELQLVSPRDCDLTRAASDLLVLVEEGKHPGEIKPEDVHTPGVYVQRVVALTSEQAADKKIEKRTVRPRPEAGA